jgi:hypothetical protein
MKHYALLFRSTRMLSAEEQKQRAADIASWVQHVTDVGIRLDPRSLGEIVGNFYRKGSEVLSRAESSDPALTTIVFFEREFEKVYDAASRRDINRIMAT